MIQSDKWALGWHVEVVLGGVLALLVLAVLLVQSPDLRAKVLRRLRRGQAAARTHSQSTSANAGLTPVLPFVPESVNYHLTRECNYKCKFCFHTRITSYFEPLERAKQGLRLLVKAGMKKINFSGGEPFLVLRGEYIGQLVRFCKAEQGVESVTVVTNGSVVRREWFDKYGAFLDIMAVSCDSFQPDTLEALGRGTGGEHYDKHLQRLEALAAWCEQYGVKFKVNSVITRLNWEEDMHEAILRLAPARWKVFQCLLIDGENVGEGARRDAQDLVITDDQFRSFNARHRDLSCLVPESNEDMRNSYLILDEYMRFLNNQGGSKRPSNSILDVGVATALQESGFDQTAFERRGGRYEWSRAPAAVVSADGADVGSVPDMSW